MTIPPWPTHTLPFSLVLLLGLGTHSDGLKAQPVPFDWHSAAIANNISGDDVRDIAVDTVNNFIYAVGVVHGNGPYGLQAYNGIPPLLQTPRRDGFLMKLNLDGSLVWAKTLGGTGSDELNAVAIGPDGNIYVTGSYQNSLSLTGVLNAVFNLGSAGGSDILVASYAPSDGSLNWIKAVSGSYGNDRGTGIVALPSGVFITGDYRRQIYFNGSINSVGEIHNSQNVFIAKYSLSGTFMASCSGGTNNDDFAGKLATDGTHIYTTGIFNDGVEARWRNPNSSLVMQWNNLATSNNAFVLSVNSSCVLNWANYMLNPVGSDLTVGAIAAGAGACGKIYIAGATHNNSIFPSNGTTTLPGNPHDFLFLAALNKTNGNTAWLRTATGPVNHANTGLDLDIGPKGEVYLAGTYTSQITWDDGTTASGTSGKEMFAARFTSYGEREWFLPITGANDDVLQAVAAGKNGALFVGGYANTNDLLLGRVSDTGTSLWPTNPSNFKLPASHCTSLGPLDLHSLLVPLHGGNAVAVTAQVGLSNIAGALGVPDGAGTEFSSNGASLTVDLGEELDTGGTVQLIWRKSTGASGTAIPKVEVSADGLTWTTVPTPPTTTTETFAGGNFVLPIATRYVRVQKDDAISTTAFVLDAFQFKTGALTGGTWSGPGVSGSTFYPAGLIGPQVITYTVSCYSTTKVIQIDPPSVGGTLSGGGSACLGTEMELSLTGNMGNTIIWNVSTDGGSTWSEDTTGQATYNVPAMLTATRVRVRSISGSCAAAISNTVQVVAADNTAPVLAGCPGNITVYTPANGCTATVNYTLPTATDNCPGTLSIVPSDPAHASGEQFPVGNTAVTINASDSFGNVSSCSFTITVVDTIRPSISCPPAVTVSTTTGCAATGVVLGTPVTNDNCGPITVTNNAPAAFPLGITHVVWTATDASGNSRTCIQQVTVTDNTPPSITCPADKSTSANAGCTATGVNLGTPVTADNCAIASVTNNSTSSYTLGITTVTWTVTDNSGNSSTCTQRITVIDITPPTLSCPAAIQVAANNGCAATGVDLGQPVATDNCEVTSLTNDAPAAFPLGTTTVTWTATDAGGNVITCAQTVTVTDTTTPTIACPANVQATTNSGCTATGVDLGTPVASDNCAGVSVTNNAPSAFPIGSTEVIWTATDASGNTATCTQTVTVTDNVLPSIACPPTVQVYANAGCTATAVDLGTPTATDNCTGVTVTNDAPAIFPIGSTTVTWTATDASGNTATCAQTVTVTDVIAPVISGPAAVQIATNAGCTATSVDLGTPDYSDNCTGTTISNDAPSAFPLGITTVTWTATDASGNSATSSQSVTVIDQTDPVAICQEATVNVDATGWAHVTTDEIDNGSWDNCSVASMSVVPADFNTLGDHTVTLTVVDAAGNSSSCTTLVHVVDNAPPTAICSDLTVHLDPSGEASIDAQELDGGSTDNGSIVAYDASTTQFTCADIGTFADTLFVTDNGGNTSFCIAQVTVLDTVAPQAQGQSIDAFLNASGEATIAASELDNGSNDACGPLTFSASNTTFTCADIGIVDLLLTVADASGNSSTASTQVTVQDTIAPVALCQSATAYLDANGFTTISASDVDAGSTDNCAIGTREVVPSVLQGAGDHAVQLFITDGSGNSHSCTAVVTVLDTIAPVALCRDTLLQLGASGTATLYAVDLDGGSSDNDSITHWAASQLVFGCADLGVNSDTLFVTDGSGNTSYCISTVTVMDPYPVNAGADSTADFCNVGASTSLFPYVGPDGQAGGSWWFQGQPVPGEFDPAVDAPGAYLYTVTNTSGCLVDSAVVTTVIHAIADPGQDTSITVCSNDATLSLITLLPGADPGGVWSNGTGLFDPAMAGSGQVLYTVDGPVGCPSATATVSILVNAAPDAGTGSSLTLCTVADPVSLFSALQGNPDASGQWTDPSGQAIGEAFDPATMGAGAYTYTVSGMAPCAQASSVVIIALTSQPSAAWSTPDPICSSAAAIDLNALVTGVAGGTWSGPGITAGSAQFDPGSLPLQGASTLFDITYTASENGCDASTTGPITVLAAPVADAGDDHSACGLTAILNASLDFGTGHWSAGSDVVFSDVNASDAVAHVTAPGSYEMHWTVTNGQCSNSDPVLVTFHVPEQLGEVDAGPDESWNIKRDSQLQGVAEGATETRWTLLGGSGYIHDPAALATAVSDLAIGANTFMLSARVGVCPFKMDTVVLVIRDFFIPSGYSPNGDGVNDNFEIIGIDVYRDNELTVFNRWGQVVYQAVGYANQWNGQANNGSPLMDDTYFYVLKFNEDATYNGQVIIKR
ncbi:MAG: HYR domain-containing protein [Flavobacteriales bacterium]